MWPTNGPDWIITPGAGPCVARGWDAHVSAEFIYWTTREDNLGFAILEPIQNGNEITTRGKVLHPDWHFEPGFKVAVGILYDHDSWDLTVRYTWLRVDHTKKSETIEDPQGLRLRPIGDNAAFGALTGPILFASANWDLSFNVVDAELGRNFFISRYLKLRPNVGLKGTWQDQHFNVFAQNATESAVDQNSMHYTGVGIRSGICTTWHFNQCFSLLGNAFVSAMWEQFEIDRTSGQVLNIEDHLHTLQPVLELFLGLRYETWFCCDRYHFALDGGWELQWWSHQNQFFNQTVETTGGDFNLNGLTLKIRLDF